MKPSKFQTKLIELIEASPNKVIRFNGINFKRCKAYRGLCKLGYSYGLGGDTWLAKNHEDIFDKSVECTEEPPIVKA